MISSFLFLLLNSRYMDLSALHFPMLNLVIIGQGAMGLLWYNHFSRQAHNINLSLLPSKRGNTVDHRFTFTHLNGANEPCHYRMATSTNINQADIILLCVKSYQVKAAINNIASLLGVNRNIILAHNGMGTLVDISQQLLNQHTFLTLLTTHGCARPTAKHIIYTGKGESDLGLISGELSLIKQQQITQLFNSALPTVCWHENIIEKQWQKLAVNCVINPLTALHNITNGEINSDVFKAIKMQIIDEIVQISYTEKQKFTAKYLNELVTKVAAATAKNCSSMRADVMAHRPTEIDYINGYVHRLGIKHNIPTPINTKLWQQINALYR